MGDHRIPASIEIASSAIITSFAHGLASETSAIYEQPGLKVTSLPGQDKLRADVRISPEKFVEHVEQYGRHLCPGPG